MASRIEGGAKFRRALKRMPIEARSEVTEALDQSIRIVQATAIALVPVMTGNLRRALASKGAIGKRDKGLRVEFGLRTKALQKKAFYAPFVEFGTKGYSPGQVRTYKLKGSKTGMVHKKRMHKSVPARPARPFLRPALDTNIPTIRRLVNSALRRAIVKASRG